MQRTKGSRDRTGLSPHALVCLERGVVRHQLTKASFFFSTKVFLYPLYLLSLSLQRELHEDPCTQGADMG